MDRKVRWSTSASNQLQDTLRFWIKNNNNSKYSKYLYYETQKATNLIKRFPEIGRLTNHPNIRRILIDKTYGIYYSVSSDYIDIKLWRSVKMNPKENKYES